MSEITAHTGAVAMPTTAIAEAPRSTEGRASHSSEIVIFSYSEFSKPSFSLDTFEQNDLGSVFSGQSIGKEGSTLGSEKKSPPFIPDEFSDPIRNTVSLPLDPFEISSAVSDFFNPVDESLPRSGVSPTPEEAVSAVNEFLGKTREKNIKDYSLKTKGLSEIARKTENHKENPITKQGEVARTEIIAPVVESITSIESDPREEIAIQNPEVSKAIMTLTEDQKHAEKTVRALLNIGVENAPEIVGRAMTHALVREKIDATVLAKLQATPASLFKPAETSLVLELVFNQENKNVPKTIFVVDTDAQEAQLQGLGKAVEQVFEQNEKIGKIGVSGRDVLTEFAKNDQQKSRLLKDSFRDDGALGESTHEIYAIKKNKNPNKILKYIHDILFTKPPVREDVSGQKVQEEDVARVFNGTPVIDKNRIKTQR